LVVVRISVVQNKSGAARNFGPSLNSSGCNSGLIVIAAGDRGVSRASLEPHVSSLRYADNQGETALSVASGSAMCLSHWRRYDWVNMGRAKLNSQPFLSDLAVNPVARDFGPCDIAGNSLYLPIEFSAGRLGLAALLARLTNDLLPKSRT